MNNEPLQTLLRRLAEEAAPPTDIDLWPKICARTSEISLSGDSRMNHPSLPRLVAMTVFVIFLLGAILLLTPQGRAWGQNLFQFFSTTEEKSIPIPTEWVMPVPPTVTPVPTYLLPLETVDVATEYPTSTPDSSCTSDEARSTYTCQVQAVEEQAGFDAWELPLDPKGMKFSKISFEPSRASITTEFVVITGGGALSLQQGISQFPEDDWGQVPSDAIEQVSVNGQYAEFVSGAFMIYPDTQAEVWEPGGLLRLRWQDGERWFSLEKMGDPYPIEWIGKDEMLALAESLVDQRPVDVAPPVDPEYLKSIEAAEALAGFDIPAPTRLPPGYELKRVAWTDEVVRLFYGPKNSTQNVLFVFMGLTVNHTVEPCTECPPGTDEAVQIGPWQGWYSRGIFSTGTSIAGQPTPTPAWDAEAREWHLKWNTDTLWISLWFSPSSDYGGEMNKETIIAIAESMK